jgi:hypothetical protein
MLQRSTLLLLLCLGFIGLQAQTTTIKDPVKYNDFIVNQQNLIGEELLVLIGMFDALPDDQQVVLDQLEIVIGTCKSSIATTKNLKAIPNEFGLKANAIALFGFYEDIMDTDYRDAIAELYAEVPDTDLLQKILTSVQEEEAKFDAAFQSSQEQFAKYHNIQLIQNEIQEEIDGAGGGE